MSSIIRHLPKVLFAVGIVLLGLAAWAYYAETAANANVLEVDRSAVDELIAQPLDPGEYDAVLRVFNSSDEPQRIVGFTPT